MKPKAKMEKRRKGNIKKSRFSKEFFLGVFIVGIMVLSGFAVMLGGFASSEQKLEYNGHKFVYTNGQFVTQIGGVPVAFSHHPAEVVGLNVSDSLAERLRNTLQIDVSYDPDSPLVREIATAQFNLKTIIEQTSDTYVMAGMTKENQYNVSVITCQDATQYVPVIIYEYANQTAIEEAGNCVFVRADSADNFMRASARLLYAYFGVI